MSVPKYFMLDGGDRMPRIGFGTWQVRVITIFHNKPIELELA